jgi:hypothetical protein
MYCVACGLDNIEGSARCIRCGQNLATLRTDNYEKPAVKSSSIVLWNPDVAALLSMPLSPLFGSIICALNWRRLGQPRRALVSWIWAAFILLEVLAIPVIGAIARLGEDAIASNFRIVQIPIFFLWYFGSAHAQGKYIVKEIRNEYRRESWFIPLCLAVVLIGSLYGLAGQLN